MNRRIIISTHGGRRPRHLRLGDLWQPVCHHEDEVEDGLSDIETVFACPDYDGNGSTFDDTDLTGASSGQIPSLVSTTIV